jgi:CO/xanthine dehydrogenase Mo-binding subunit
VLRSPHAHARILRVDAARARALPGVHLVLTAADLGDFNEGQIHGGVAQGIGGAFYERVVYDASGQLLSGSFMDFLVPTAVEVPEIEIVHRETPSPLNPLGVKGVGEAGAIPVPALVAEAVDDALAPFGVRIQEMPLSPGRILEILAQARSGRGAT